MKRLGLLAVVFAMAVMLYRPATGQDNYEERISSLETRVAVLEGAPGSTPAAATITITGWVTYGDIGGESLVPSGIRCSIDPAAGGPIPEDGQPVTVRDQDGTIVGTSQLYPGVYAPGAEDACVFGFLVENVAPADYYAVEVGALAVTTVSAQDLASSSYSVEIVTGDPVSLDNHLFLTQTAPTPAP